MPVCLLIADDLTGACDAAVHFAMRGHRTVVSLDSLAVQRPAWSAENAVAAFTTESRGLCPPELGAMYAGMAREGGRFSSSALLFKKIDSTLRGNAGIEIAWFARAFACRSAIVTPAFPAMGRTVESGVLRVAGAGFGAIDALAYWRAQGLTECAWAPAAGVPAALAAGTLFIAADASSDCDLDAIAAAGLASPRRILWAGSAGLAAALARAVPHGSSAVVSPSPDHCAVLFCIGSGHPVTTEQQRALAAARPLLELHAETAEPLQVAEALSAGTHVALRIPYGRVAPERIRQLIGRWRGPLVLSGGATASLVCLALGVREIRLHREVAPGIPRGAIAGGVFDGAPIVTKSGGFGERNTLIRILDDLTCPQ
jgi:uncharacterized protein YgbK (DUF1537 family)